MPASTTASPPCAKPASPAATARPAAAGNIDLPAAAAALRFELRPAMPDPPVLGLRVTGPLAAPVRTPELADVTRWRAEHPPAQ